MKQKNKQHILARYGLIIGLIIAISMVVTAKLFYTTVIDAAEWDAAAKGEMAKTDPIYPERGNILSDNGNILACNILAYDVKFDMAHEVFVKKKVKIKSKSWDSLADSLDRYYPMVEGLEKLSAEKRKEKSWRTRLARLRANKVEKRNRAVYLVKAGTLDDFERLKTFPVFKQFAKRNGYYNPLYYTENHVRVYPFGKMAELSIGRVNHDKKGQKHGYSGLENDLDSLLYGKIGKSKKVPLTTGMTSWPIEAPVRGYDVHTTISIDMQDMLEEELKKACVGANAIWGTAIIMETRTGDIKAISNLEKLKDGSYGEALNRAVLAYEPGSVMKPISMMIAFEDGLVSSVNDAVDTSPFQGTTDRHAPTVKTMKQVIEMSSNTGIARVIFRGYKDNPEAWHKRLEEIGFFERFHTGIHQERVPFVPELGPERNGVKQTMTARLLSLARQTYGYNTMIPPLYTLAYYNAIANGGELVHPRLIQGLRDEQGHYTPRPARRKRICSEETARKVRECIREVVLSKHGTGHMLEDDRVAIAGKTGTAYPISHGAYDLSFRRFAFAGFFPYDNPKYTMMVLILAPAGNSAARTSGMVLKNMALRLYSRGKLDNVSTFTAERSDSKPVLVASESANYGQLRSSLEMGAVSRFRQGNPVKPGCVPDLRGYDPKTAVATLEKLGLNVKLSGAGYVAEQSVPPGTPVARGASVILKLKI